MFQMMVEESPFPSALLSASGQFEFVNRSFVELHQINLDQLLGRKMIEIIDPPDHVTWSEAIENLTKRNLPTAGVEVRSANPYHPKRYRYRVVPFISGNSLSKLIVYAQTIDSKVQEHITDFTTNAAQILFEKSPIPMWVFDVQSLRFLEVNKAALKRYGYTREEFLQLTTKDIRPKDELPKLLSAVMDIGSVPYPSTRWIHQRKDRSTFFAEVFAAPIRFGKESARLVLSFDVTERVNAERALQERTTMLEALGDNLPGGAIYQIIQEPNGKFRFSYFSAGFERMFGWSRSEVLENPDALLNKIHPEDMPGYLEAQQRAMESQTLFKHEFRQGTVDGNYKWIVCQSAPRQLLDGNTAWDGVVMETTDQKRTEEALRQQQNLLRSLGDNLPGGGIYQYITTGLDSGYYTYVSAGIEAISELKCDDLLQGKVRLRDLMVLEDRERMRRVTDLVANTEQTTDAEVHVKLPSGKDRVWHIRSAVYRRNDGNVVWDGVILDITDRRKLDAQVQQAQKFQSVSVLAGGIAHDFNNLLTGVLGYAELAAEEIPKSDPAFEFLQEISISARRAADLCQQMLAYAGRGKLVRGATNLSELVREMSRLLKTVISRKAELQLNLADDLPRVVGDATQLRQVVMNLITNASESLEEKPGIIAVRTGVMKADTGFFQSTVLREGLPSGDYVYLEVEDTGCGMTPETQHRIFEPFFTTKFSGRGLGLAALLGIVRGHRGAVRVTSHPGRGTIFRIVFPVDEQRTSSEPLTPSRGVKRLRVGPILVIDDEESIRNVSQTILTKEGFSVMLAQDGAEGVNHFQKQAGNYLIVLTDLTMPKLSGLETLASLRTIQPDVKVILMSGYNEAEVQGRYSDFGFVGFLQKPFSPAELLQAIDRGILKNAPNTSSR